MPLTPPSDLGPLTDHFRKLSHIKVVPNDNGHHVDFDTDAHALTQWIGLKFGLAVRRYTEAMLTIRDSLKGPMPVMLGPNTIMVAEGDWAGLTFIELLVLYNTIQAMNGDVEGDDDGFRAFRQEIHAAFTAQALVTVPIPNPN